MSSAPPPPPPPPVYFPLRWESTGDQWWYATPVDLAAANGHYELVRALLVADSNLLIKLTSLRRLRRLESLWDDHPNFLHAPLGRAAIARRLLCDCESRNSGNSLIRAGYGGWLLYTAAAAGETDLIQELLRREPLLVFGEGEYGVTDILYAASRSRNRQVFRMLLCAALNVVPARQDGKDGGGGMWGTFRMEVMNRALHAAARGGNWEVLTELILDYGDVMMCRDVNGCTVLHAAAGRGQVKVVKNLVRFPKIMDARDTHGNTALHLAGYRGNLEVVKVLVFASPSSSSTRNNAGDTFLHMTVAGFRTPGFRRMDRQTELMKELVRGEVVYLPEIINLKNNEGRTALHLAVIGNIHCDLVQLLMMIPSIDLNVRDLDGMTPLDLLIHRPKSAVSEILKKQLSSAGGTSNSKFSSGKASLVSQLKMHNISCSSPGTCFRISDSEIFLYTGMDNMHEKAAEKVCGVRSSSCSNSSNEEIDHMDPMDENDGSSQKPRKSFNSAANRLRSFLGWSHKKLISKKPGRESQTVDHVRSEAKHGIEESLERKHMKFNDHENALTPLRQRFSKTSSLSSSRRTLAVRTITPNPSTKKKIVAGLVRGVMQGMPHLALPFKSPSKHGVKPPSVSPSSDKLNGILHDHGPRASKTSNAVSCDRLSSSSRSMNQYFCLGSQGPLGETHMTNQQGNPLYGHSILLEA